MEKLYWLLLFIRVLTVKGPLQEKKEGHPIFVCFFAPLWCWIQPKNLMGAKHMLWRQPSEVAQGFCLEAKLSVTM